MKNNIAKIRAALEQATGGRPSNIAAAQAALAALAELEKAAAEPVAWIIGKPTHGHEIGRYLAWNAGHVPHSVGSAAEPLYAAPPAPVAEIRKVVVTDELCLAVVKALHNLPQWRYHKQYGRYMIDSVRCVLGPTLGLVELKEPTPEECDEIDRTFYMMPDGTSGYPTGRQMFDSVRAVMWPKEGL